MLRIKTVLDEGAFLPCRAHPTDAGLDLFSPIDMIVRAHGSAIFPTGVHVQLPPDTDGQIWSKSGLNINSDIITTGLIDEGYTGMIVVKLFNHGMDDYIPPRRQDRPAGGHAGGVCGACPGRWAAAGDTQGRQRIRFHGALTLDKTGISPLFDRFLPA